MTDSTRHANAFAHFSRAELASGGPDPQVEVAAAVARQEARTSGPAVGAWVAGSFVAPYTLAAGVAIYRRWPLESSVGPDNEVLIGWLAEHKEGLPIRRERRVVWGSPEKLAACLVSFASWAVEDLPDARELPYPELYESVKGVRYFGRYATMKVIEVMHRAGLVEHGQSDIRADGGWSPRRTLGLLRPEIAGREKVNRAADVERAESLAHAAKPLVDPVSWFQLETLLCNYRQAFSGKYPGRSHDRELAHYLHAREHWGPELDVWSRFFALRDELFDREYLGEHGGWYAARPELEEECAARYAG